MATPVSPNKDKKKVTRHVSRSPKRHISPQKAQPDIQFDSEELPYSDPIDSSRSLGEYCLTLVTNLSSCLSIVQNVTFERRDYQHLTSQAVQLFSSKKAFEDEAERTWLLTNMRSTTILVKVDDTVYSINGNYSFKFVDE